MTPLKTHEFHRFDDCFKLGKRIDETPYLLPDPEILKKTPEDELEIPISHNVTNATSADPKSLSWPPLPPDGDTARPPATIFQDRAVLLSPDLGITGRLSKAVQDIIIDGGGKIVEDADDCDMLICQYRDGSDYVQAAQSCKHVGNLAWLYYLIVHNEWTSPLRRLLHYPIPKGGIEGFKGLRITVSNYGGDARIYLENLIKACGAEFTKTMKADNTHLITARNSSEKCRVAPEWGWLSSIIYGSKKVTPNVRRNQSIFQSITTSHHGQISERSLDRHSLMSPNSGSSITRVVRKACHLVRRGNARSLKQRRRTLITMAQQKVLSLAAPERRKTLM